MRRIKRALEDESSELSNSPKRPNPLISSKDEAVYVPGSGSILSQSEKAAKRLSIADNDNEVLLGS